MPISAASSRDDQCVTPSLAGGGSSVLITISSGSIRFGRPDRGWSSRAPSPPSAYRFRHKITVLLIEPNRPWQDTDLLTQPPSPNYWALEVPRRAADRKSTRLNSSHLGISYAVF